MKTAPQLKSLMSPFPYAVGIDDAVAHAQALMAEHGVRHVPVRDGQDIAGVITDHDILVAQARGAIADSATRVRDVCTFDPYVVSLDEPLDDVLLTMAERRISCVIIVHHGRLAGVFTATDACRGFGELVREWFPGEPDPQVA